jgi:glycosyltransferase involved in cell wall biosynthesis
MGYGNCVLTLATPENIEAVGDAGIPYENEFDLAEKLQRVLRDGSLVQSYRNRAQVRVQRYYDWDRVVDQYERLFAEISGKGDEMRPSVAGVSALMPNEEVFARK